METLEVETVLRIRRNQQFCQEVSKWKPFRVVATFEVPAEMTLRGHEAAKWNLQFQWA